MRSSPTKTNFHRKRVMTPLTRLTLIGHAQRIGIQDQFHVGARVLAAGCAPAAAHNCHHLHVVPWAHASNKVRLQDHQS